MKLKSYVLLAASGLIAASCAFVAPVFADDISNSMYPPDSNTGSGMNGPMTPPAPGTETGNPSATDMSNSASNDMTTNPTGVDMNNNTAVANPDDGNTPDTATGDDDY